MSTLMNAGIILLVGLVTLVLLMGLTVMMRNGDASLSQKLMRMRIGLQFLAVMLIMTAFYFNQG